MAFPASGQFDYWAGGRCLVTLSKYTGDFDYWAGGRPIAIGAPAAGGNIVTVNIAARSARLRGADAVVPTKALFVVARAARLRASDTVSVTKARGIVARAARLRAANGIVGVRVWTIVARAARVRGRDTAGSVTGNTILANLAARLRLRAADVAYPLTTAPASTKSLSAQTPRLGLTPADADAARLGTEIIPTDGRRLG
jgi:hypothetical protein